jgi:diguanylate cyclase with GGDEF domain
LPAAALRPRFDPGDGFGHEAGDRLLIQVAGRLRAAVREGDMVARLGGEDLADAEALLRDADSAMYQAKGAFEGFEHARDHGFHLAGVAPNLVLFVNSLLVGFFTARTQLARRPVLGGWSLSGAAQAGVFSTCALTHLVASLTTAPDVHTLTLDDLGVPASIFFLYAVHRLHRRSLRDWNRAPLVGRAAPLGRRSPWAVAADERPAPANS